MTTITITCGSCFEDYEPSRADIMKGIKHWRLCPGCRTEPDEREADDAV